MFYNRGGPINRKMHTFQLLLGLDHQLLKRWFENVVRMERFLAVSKDCGIDGLHYLLIALMKNSRTLDASEHYFDACSSRVKIQMEEVDARLLIDLLLDHRSAIHSLGQHFLHDESILNEAISLCRMQTYL